MGEALTGFTKYQMVYFEDEFSLFSPSTCSDSTSSPAMTTRSAVRPSTQLASARRRFLLLLLVWGGIVAAGAALGLPQRIPTPLVPVPLALALIGLVGVYAGSARVRRAVADEDLRVLTLFHAWRVPAGIAFLWYGAHGELPSTFAMLAGWGDVLAGVLAVGVVGVLSRNTASGRTGYVAFHAFGMLDFVVAVGTGFTFSILGDPLMDTIKSLPLVLIVFFGVPVTGALGIATLHRLLRTSAAPRDPDSSPAASG